MQIINWHPEINSKRLLPYNYSEASTIISEENDIGTAKTRQRTTGVVKYHTFDMMFTSAEWELLKNWVRLNIRGGALPFYFKSDICGNMDIMRLVTGESWFTNYRLIRGKAENFVKITLQMEQQP